MSPARLAELLGLGTTRGEPRLLKPGDKVWRVGTDSGDWVIKTVRPSGDRWAEDMTRAGRLERAAAAAGLPIAQPREPGPDATGMWTPIGDGRYARATRFVPGQHPVTPLDPATAAWAGRILAGLERLALDAGTPTAHTVPDTAQWNDLLSGAEADGVLETRVCRELRAATAATTELVTVVPIPPVRLAHRDIGPVNILSTSDGAVLLDFDRAGPQVPWWECVGTAFTLASPNTKLGAEPASRGTVHTVLNAYLDAGGVPGPADRTAFTGLLAARLSFTAFQLRVACGRLGHDATARSRAASYLRQATIGLPGLVDRLDVWSDWLTEAVV